MSLGMASGTWEERWLRFEGHGWLRFGGLRQTRCMVFMQLPWWWTSKIIPARDPKQCRGHIRRVRERNDYICGEKEIEGEVVGGKAPESTGE